VNRYSARRHPPSLPETTDEPWSWEPSCTTARNAGSWLLVMPGHSYFHSSVESCWCSGNNFQALPHRLRMSPAVIGFWGTSQGIKVFFILSIFLNLLRKLGYEWWSHELCWSKFQNFWTVTQERFLLVFFGVSVGLLFNIEA
jgi:hypothetical protein